MSRRDTNDRGGLVKVVMLVSGSVYSSLTHRALSFARALAGLGHEVVLVAPMADKYNNFQPVVVENGGNIKIVHPRQFVTSRRMLNLLPYVVSAALCVPRLRPDVVHIYKPTPITIIGLLPKLLWRTPVLLDMDDLGSEVMAIEGCSAAEVALVRWCERRAARWADAIVVASTFLHRTYQAAYPGKSITCIANGVDASSYRHIYESPAREEGPDLVVVSTLNRKNIVEPLIRAMPEITRRLRRRVRLRVVGDGNCLSYFKGLAATLELVQQIEFAGWVERPNIAAYLKLGDVGYCYMPNDRTTVACSNMKVFEYLAAGVVPVVSDVGDLPAYVDYGRAGYVCPHDDSAALVDCLTHALADSTRIDRARRGGKLAAESYDWAVLTTELEAVYLTLARYGRGRRCGK